MVICHPSNYTACSFSKYDDLKGSAMLFLIVASVCSGAAAIIYALSLLVLLHDFVVPLKYSAFPHNSIFRVSSSYRVELLIQEGPIKQNTRLISFETRMPGLIKANYLDTVTLWPNQLANTESFPRFSPLRGESLGRS